MTAGHIPLLQKTDLGSISVVPLTWWAATVPNLGALTEPKAFFAGVAHRLR
jgi:hypothetical protein